MSLRNVNELPLPGRDVGLLNVIFSNKADNDLFIHDSGATITVLSDIRDALSHFILTLDNITIVNITRQLKSG